MTYPETKDRIWNKIGPLDKCLNALSKELGDRLFFTLIWDDGSIKEETLADMRRYVSENHTTS